MTKKRMSEITIQGVRKQLKPPTLQRPPPPNSPQIRKDLLTQEEKMQLLMT